MDYRNRLEPNRTDKMASSWSSPDGMIWNNIPGGDPGEFTPHEWDVLAFSPKKHDGGSNKDFSITIYSMGMKPT